MKKLCRKLAALLLVCCMMLNMLPMTMAAEGGITITANTKDGTTITVQETVLDEKEKDLFTSEGALTAEIQRDYSQMVDVVLKNTAASAVEYYLTVDNPNADLSMNFVDPATTKDSPVILAAGETITAKLAIFAQEAEKASYDNITLVSHVVNEGKTERKLNLTVKGPGLSLTPTVTTLANGNVQVKLTNTGAAVNSLKVVADDTLASYAYFPTAITNYVLAENGTLTFEVVPSGVATTVSGNLLAKGNGSTVEIPVTLTNPDYEIITGRELAQSDNVVAGLEIVDNISLTKAATAEDSVKLNVGYTFGENKTLPVSIGMMWSETTQELPADEIDRIEATQSIDRANKKISIKLTYLMSQAEFQALTGSGAASVSLMDDSVTNVLAEYDIDIDVSSIPEGDWDQLVEDFNNACDGSSRLDYINNLPDLPAGIRDQYNTALQIQMLLNLLNQDKDGKYDELKRQLEEELNKQYEPDVEDPIATLKKTLDKLVENLEKKIKKKYDDFSDAVIDDMFNPPELSGDEETTLDEIKEEEQDPDWSMVVIEEDGRQCTNRGKIDSNFYAKDEYDLGGSRLMADGVKTAADIGARVFYTGRIVSEDDYVHFMPVSYDLKLNGTSFGKSVNSGLSELNIIELDPTLVILGQTNSFTRDYDVNPGNHFINTDNVFTILYPADVQLGITDPSQVKIATPDFDVYKKNIFAATEEGGYIENPVAGENYLHISVSNRGGHGGFYKLSVKCGGVELLSEEEAAKYRYLPAFTSRVLKVEADLAVGTNDITVTMTDCSGRILEESSAKENNTATMTLTARERQVPEVTVKPSGQVAPGNVVLEAAVTKGLDVKLVEFFLDSELCGSVAGNGKETNTYSVSVGSLNLNESYDLRVVVTYEVGAANDPHLNEIEKESSFRVSAMGNSSQWAEVTLPEGAEIDEALLLTQEDRYPHYDDADFGYVLTEAASGYVFGVAEGADPTDHILVGYDKTAGVLYAGVVGAKDTAVALTADRTLTLADATFDNPYIEAYVPGVYESFDLKVTEGSNTVKVPAMLLEFNGGLKIGNSYLWLDLPVIDLRSADQSVNVADGMKIFTAILPSNAEGYAWYQARYYYRYNSNSQGSTYLDWEAEEIDGVRHMTMALNKNNLPDTVQDAHIALHTEEANDMAQPRFLFIKESEFTENLDVTKAVTRKLSFTAEDPSKLTVTTVSITPDQWYNSRNINLGENQTILCTPMKYTLDISFQYSGMSYMVSQTVDLTNSDQTVNLTTAAMTAQLQVQWPAGMGHYAELSLSPSNSDGNMSMDNISSGSSFKVAPGMYSAYLTVYTDDPDNWSYVEYYANLKLEDGKTTVLDLNGQITGELEVIPDYDQDEEQTEYLPGSLVEMRLNDVTDANGNYFEYLYSDKGLSAYVIFTNVETGKQITSALEDCYSINSYGRFDVAVPNEAGTYTMKFVLNQDPSDTVMHEIKAMAGAGGSISPSGTLYLAEGTSRTFDISADRGYQIADVLVDGRSVGAVSTYTFENVTAAHTIEAKFEQTSAPVTPEVEVVRPSKPSNAGMLPFADVRKTDWFFDDVKYVYENGLMNGVSDSLFDPNGTTTRAMIVTILWRMEGEPVAKGQTDFIDVSTNMWYTEAIRWAASEGIVNGYGDTFGPTDPITREQMATILYRYNQYKNEDVRAGENANLLSYNDADSVSSYAQAALQWACGEGLINGADGKLMPAASATRAQCAAILHRMLED